MHILIYNAIIRRTARNFKIKSLLRYSTADNLTEELRTMPRDSESFKNARAAYNARKNNIGKHLTDVVKLEVIGSGAQGAPTSLNVFTPNVRYMFNIGENTQRTANEWRVKLAKVPHIFITHPSWKNLGGLLGVCLTVQNLGVPELFIHGHSIIESFFSATNRFALLKKIKVTVKECNSNVNYSDGVLTITCVHLYPNKSEKVTKSYSDKKMTSVEKIINMLSDESGGESSYEDDIDYYDYLGKNNRNKRKGERSKQRSQSEAPKPKLFSDEMYAIAYICRSQDKRGTLFIDKCIELGLRPGPVFADLKNGKDIELENGKIIRSSDVTSPVVPGAIIIIVECPTEEYLDSLLKEPTFFKHQKDAINLNDIAEVVVHFTDSHIMDHPKYKEWMERFPESTKHVLINDGNECLGSHGVHSQQYLLNLLHSEIFPLLYPATPPFSSANKNCSSEHILVKSTQNEVKDSNETIDQNENVYDKEYYKCGNSNLIKGQTLCEIFVRPRFEYDFAVPAPFKPESWLEKAMAMENLPQALEKLQLEIKKLEPIINQDKEKYPKILFLGTGSSIPSKKRNASGILIFLDEKRSILFDCGEGTFVQLVRFFGKEKAKEVLRHLNIIFISHLHADHHMGLITLLKERRAVFSDIESESYPKPAVFAPVQILSWLRKFNTDIEPIMDLFDLVPNLKKNQSEHDIIVKSRALEMSNLKQLNTSFVEHCLNAFGVAIIHENGWKLTYSGDTKPSHNLITLGLNSDILIHEATFTDFLKDEAERKRHSTTSQAIEVGRKMNAKFTILTHFSQRHSHLPLMDEVNRENIGIAFDNMMVSKNQLPLLPLFYDALKILFSEQYELMKKKLLINELRKRKFDIDEKTAEIPEKLRSLVE